MASAPPLNQLSSLHLASAIAVDLSDSSDYLGADATRVGQMRPPKSDKALVPVPVGMDWALFANLLALITIGVVMAYSASVYLALRAGKGDDQLFLNKHLVHTGVTVVVMLIGAHIPYQFWRKVAYPGLMLALGMLILTLMFGVVVNGSRRWLPLPGFMFQTAELAKFAFVVFLAHSLTKKIDAERVHKFTVGFLPHALAWMFMFSLCMKQPDLGSGIVLAVLLFAMTYIAGTRMAYVVLAGGAGIALLASFVAQNPMRFKRFLAFLDPLAYRDTTGYQLFNGQLAVATGNWFGNGLGLSKQKLGFVPECHTDFILSIIAEELGLIGVALVALGFVFLILRGLRIALRARDEFGRLLAAGITLLFGTQAAVNFGVVMGLLPTKGLTLPFISHGGSSMLIMGLAAGVLLNVGRGGNPDLPELALPSWLKLPSRRTTSGPQKARSGQVRAVDRAGGTP